jgi:hypothetical protein
MLPNHKPQEDHPNINHLLKILNIFHTMGRLPNHKPYRLLDHEAWAGHLNRDHI